MEKIKNSVFRILRRSEKWTGTDMVYLASGGFWLSLGQFFSSLTGLALAVVFANFLPAETYGDYKYVLSIFAILSITTLPGLGTAVEQALARNFDGSFTKAFRLKIKWGLLGLVAGLGIAAYYFSFNKTLGLAFLIISLFITLVEALGLYNSILLGKREFKKVTIYSNLDKLITATAVIAAILLSKNLIVIIFAYFTANLSIKIFLLALTLKKIKLNKQVDEQTASYGKHLSVISLLEILALNVDKIILFNFLGAAQLAVYSFAIIVPEQIKGYLKNISSLAMPKFSAHDSVVIRKTIFQKTAKWFLMVLVIIILYIATAPVIFKILFPKYVDAVFYSQLFAVSSLAITTMPLHALLKAKKAKKGLYIHSSTTYSLQLILMAILGYFGGILGIITARIISRAYGSLILIILTNKYIK